jgi:hypothetical protein
METEPHFVFSIFGNQRKPTTIYIVDLCEKLFQN